ncbi:hypothetical protein [Streptomyces sp. NPDC005438]|uniref:hypothetical protein n=1 Tax=Streptomyces sp. NPDC005438 TaxID=3156880 RepID=UPI0033A75557
MSIRHVRTSRRAAAATLLAATLTFSLAACGGGDDDKPKEEKSQSSKKESDDDGDKGKTAPDTSKTLATLKGDKGIDMVVHEAKRDSGGFLTINGTFKNTSGGRVTVPLGWGGQESEIKRSGRSLAGMTLVDSKAKKRYYVLRDTDNRPLTTADFSPGLDDGESLAFFAQFPAPPDSSTEVNLTFPGFPTTSIEIS